MRKLIPVLFIVFALALGLGALAPAPAEAGNGLCYYTCGCNGQVLYCCGTACKPATGDPPISCPQVVNC